jgi:HK97 family phage prohead protease
MPTRERPDELDRWQVKVDDAHINLKQRVITCYASTWEPDAQGDAVLPTAFDATLRERKLTEIPLYWLHRHEEVPVGRPLALQPDAKGLHAVARLFRTARGDEVLAYCAEMLAAGEAPGVSIGFIVNGVDWRRVNGKTVRAITALDLKEISLTPPHRQANKGSVVLSTKSAATFAPVRSREDLQADLVELDGYLGELQAKERDACVAAQAQDRERRAAVRELEWWSYLHNGGPDPRKTEQRKMAREVEARVQAELAADRDEIARRARAEAESRQAREWWLRNVGRPGK